MKANKVNTFDVLDLKGKCYMTEIHHKIFNYGVKGDVIFLSDENGKLLLKNLFIISIANTCL